MVVIPFLLSESDSPISILEAKACGRPVISNSVAGIPDLIGRGGIVLESCTVNDLTQEICGLIEDPSRLQLLTEYAVAETRAHASWDSACDVLVSALEKSIDR